MGKASKEFAFKIPEGEECLGNDLVVGVDVPPPLLGEGGGAVEVAAEEDLACGRQAELRRRVKLVGGEEQVSCVLGQVGEDNALATAKEVFGPLEADVGFVEEAEEAEDAVRSALVAASCEEVGSVDLRLLQLRPSHLSKPAILRS